MDRILVIHERRGTRLAYTQSQMSSDATLVKPAGVDDVDPRLDLDLPIPTPPGRRRRILAVVAVVLAIFVSGLCLLTVFAGWRDDVSITTHLGRADADVLSVALNRTAVRFVTPDGTVHIPVNGVLYPDGLAAGERVRVEYDTADPDLVRVAGRDFTLSFQPAGTTVLGLWAVAGGILWWSRRPRPTHLPAAVTGRS